MTISVICPTCGRQFSKIKSEMAGKKVRCACGKSLRLPDPKPASNQSTHSQQSIKSQKPDISRSTAGSNDATDPQAVVGNARKPFEFHYSDLDLLLTKPKYTDSDFDPLAPVQRRKTKPTIAFPPEPVGVATVSSLPVGHTNGSKVRQASAEVGPIELNSRGIEGPNRIGFLFALAMTSFFAAFGFAMFLLSARLATVNFVWQGTPDETLRQIYSGQFGMDAMVPGLRLGLKLVGWVILGVACTLMLVAALQILNAGIQLFASLPFLRWVDGLMATLAVTMLFLLIGTIFLHGSHMHNLKRKIDQATVVADGEEPANIQRLRGQLKSDSEQFQWSIAGISIAPATIFGCSMLRLLIRSKV